MVAYSRNGKSVLWKPWFYLKRVGVKIKKPDSSSCAANKVLPITDSESDELRRRPHKMSNAVSRMKAVVVGWATSAPKSGRRMLMNFKKKPITLRDNDQLSNESPKISFKLDMEVSSPRLQTTDALNSSSSFTFRNEAGNWITTDSEFVVLEL